MTTELMAASETQSPSPQAVLYLRVSSKKQMDTAVDIDRDGNSIATQREAGLRKAASLGATVIKEFIEPGVSASTIEGRRAFQDMLAFLREHRDVKLVIVYARSRAFRNYIDAAITKRLLDKLDVKLVSVREEFGDGIYADMMEAVTDIFNDVQNKLSGEDIRIKMQHKAVNGGTLGRARIGYLNTRVDIDGRQVNTVTLDPKRAPLVLKAWELYATGDYSIDRLAATMADLGLTSRPSARWPHEKPMSESQLHRMLRDPYYAGYVVYKGELYPGRHEAIVTQELFDRVQNVLDARSARGQRDRVLQHYLKGTLFCGRCQSQGKTARLIYTEAKSHTGKRYGYFLCRGRQEGLCDLPHLSAARVEQAIVEHYATLQLPDDFANEVRIQLEEALSNEQGNVRELHASLNRQLKKLDEKESRLIDLAADGAMPTAKIRAKLNELRRDRTRIEAGLTNTGEELSVGASLLRDTLDLLANPQQLYRDGNNTIRRHLNQTFFLKFYIDDLEVVGDELTPLFAEVQHANNVFQVAAYREQHDPPRTVGHVSTKTDLPTLGGVFSSQGSSKAVMVELRGFEPLTYSMRTSRATNCAIAPDR